MVCRTSSFTSQSRERRDPVRCHAPLVDRREIRNTSGIPEERLVIRTPLVIAGRRWPIEVSLADRETWDSILFWAGQQSGATACSVNPGRSYLTKKTTRGK